MKFIAKLQYMSDADILRYIPTAVYNEIKASDPNPEFRAYSIGHEGESQGHWAGVGKIVQRWYRSAIEKIYATLQYGTKFFYNHDPETNEHGNRLVVGELVGKVIKNIQNAVNTVAIAYIYPDYKDKELDVASIEADVLVGGDTNEVRASDVLDITGIALGSSKEGSRPAFKGATLLASIQAFINENDSNNKEDQNKIMGNEKTITIEDVKAFIKGGKTLPSEVYSESALTSDPIVIEHVKEKVQGEYVHRKRTDEKFDKSRGDWEKEKADLQKENETLKAKIQERETEKIFKGIISERKGLEEPEKKYLEKVFNRFKAEKPETVKEDLNKFVDDSLKEFIEVAKTINPDYKGSSSISKNGKEGEKKNGAGETDEDPGAGEDGEDLTKPENNDFIPV